MSDFACRVVAPQPSARPEIGDVLYGSRFLSRVDVRVAELKGKRLVQGKIRFDMADIGVDIGALEAVYTCPWTGNRHYWMFPLGVLTDDMDRYRLDANRPWRHRLIYPHGRNTADQVDPSMVTGYGAYGRWEDDYGRIVDAMMGHGFTEGTLPGDGHGHKVLATVPLSNGDEILVSCWIWYNR